MSRHYDQTRMHVRPASLDDLDMVSRIDRAAFPVISYPRFTLRQLFDLCGPGFLVCEEQRALQGFAIFAARDAELWFLLAIATAPESRNKGVASALLARGVAHCQDERARELRLTVSPTNPARRLYEAAGFRTVAEDPSYYGDDSPRLVMALALPPKQAR